MARLVDDHLGDTVGFLHSVDKLERAFFLVDEDNHGVGYIVSRISGVVYFGSLARSRVLRRITWIAISIERGETSAMSAIFISNRQDDAKAWAITLRDDLAQVFGETEVFLDKDTLEAGDWPEQIQDAPARCKVLLVVIGKRWLRVADEQNSNLSVPWVSE